MKQTNLKSLYLDPRIEMTAYQPSKSTGFGHRTRTKNVQKAWASIENFLEKHTYYKNFYDSPIKLSCWQHDNCIEEYAVKECIEQAQALFGPSIHSHDWLICNEKLPIALEFALNNEQRNNQKISPIELNFSHSFLWKKFANSSLIESPQFEDEILFRTITSTISIYIEQDYIFIQPKFIFPCAWDSIEFADIYNNISKDCPILLKEKNFYKMILRKDQKGHYWRKLPVDWKQQQPYLLSS